MPEEPTASEAVSPFAPTTSSVLPSAVIAEERIEELIVSPVANEAVMIAVPSISPATIKAARPRRRLAFRTPRRKNTRFRSAKTATTESNTTTSTASTSASESTGIPNSFCMAHLAVAGASATTTSYASRPGDARKNTTSDSFSIWDS